MVLSQIDYDRNKHWECLFLVSLKDIKEVVVFKETHGSVSNLQMDTSNALNNSLEKL